MTSYSYLRSAPVGYLYHGNQKILRFRGISLSFSEIWLLNTYQHTPSQGLGWQNLGFWNMGWKHQDENYRKCWLCRPLEPAEQDHPSLGRAGTSPCSKMQRSLSSVKQQVWFPLPLPDSRPKIRIESQQTLSGNVLDQTREEEEYTWKELQELPRMPWQERAVPVALDFEDAWSSGTEYKIG